MQKLKTQQVAVFVVDREDKLCLPTNSARARRLLAKGAATVKQVIPFTIRLNRVVENPVGEFTVGIDDGAKRVGVAIVNETTQQVVFHGEIELRQDVTRKMTQRAMYRRTRRGRNLRHRPARFLNRKQCTPVPSARQRKDSIIRFLKDMQGRVNITRAVVEEGMFDTASMVAGRKLDGKEYQIADCEGKDFRAKVLWRDRYTCQRCKSTEQLRAHHIRHRANSGTNTPGNGITLCEQCHTELHSGLWVLKAKPKRFVYPTWLMVGKTYLRKELSGLGLEVSTCTGWMTTHWRQSIGIEKSHANDAIAMVCRYYTPDVTSLSLNIKPRRNKVWEDHPSKTCDERYGFRRYDVVKASHRTRGWVMGSVRALNKAEMRLRTSFDDNFGVSYRKSRLLQRPAGLIFTIV